MASPAARAAMRDRLWDPDLGTFVSYDRVGDRPLRANSVAGLAALYGGTPTSEQFDRLRETLEASSLSREYFDPDTGEGRGSDRLSWTAALYLDRTA